MSDLKISALPSATLPLAGTEVLPIVQGGVTTKVAVSDLTAGRAVTAASVNKVAITAPATASTLTIADGKTLAVNDNVTLGTGGLTLGNSGGFTAAASKVLTASNSLTLAGTDATTHTFPTTSATIARTDAAQTFTGNQTITGSVSATAGISSHKIATGIDIGNIGVGGQTPFPSGLTLTFTGGSGELIIVEDGGTGRSAVLFATYASATISILSDLNSVVVNSNTPGATQFGVFKSANDFVISIKNGWATQRLIVISVFGQMISAVTAPA